MRQRILKSVSILVVVSVLTAFAAASLVMYEKFRDTIRQGVRNEAEFIRIGVEKMGETYLLDQADSLTDSRITLINQDGSIAYDSEGNPDVMENHSDRPELVEAREKGRSETVRHSETLSQQTFYYALLLQNGQVLRISKTTESVFQAMLSGTTLLGIVLFLVLLFTIFLVNLQTQELIRPINELDLEHPLKNVVYAEMKPLMVRLENQNRQIAEQLEELQKADAVRREFSANVSHELKTPLMSISGYAEIIENGMVKEKDIQEFAGRIHHEANRLTTLVEDIIELSKLDEKSSELPVERVDLVELTRDVVYTLEHPALKKDIALSFEGRSPLYIRGVHHTLYEMLYNLTDNAIKYTGEGGRVQICAGRNESGVFWQIEDNGIGIAEEDQQRIFERFYRVDKSHSRETGGTGLGLSIVKHGAMLHNARIDLKSAVGEGTRIQLIFPVME